MGGPTRRRGPPRAPARLLVTEGPGYALRAAPGTVDAWRFEQAVAAATTESPRHAPATLEEALGWWRGPAYADFAEENWARADGSRLGELRLHAVERAAEARLALGRVVETVPDLDAHVSDHPSREEAWGLLALALYRTGRQSDALAVLRRARMLLREQLGVDPGPGLRRLEADILEHAPHLDRAPAVGGPAVQVWAEATAAYDRSVTSGTRARLDSTVGLLRNFAVTGGDGLLAARRHRVAAITAAEELGDPEVTARVIGAYDVPAIWTRVDDPEQAAGVVAAAERTLAAFLLGAHPAARARLLATIALESRGTHSPRGHEAAREAEEIARSLDAPTLLAFALNAVFMQSFQRAGLAPLRDSIGAEQVALSARNGLATWEVLGHLIRLQVRGALGDSPGADRHAADAGQLAERHELPLVGVFTRWYRALRLAATGGRPAAEEAAAYQEAAALLGDAACPGWSAGCCRSPCCASAYGTRSPRKPTKTPTGDRTNHGSARWCCWPATAATGSRQRCSGFRPPRDLLFEALWCLVARAAVAVGDRATMERAHTELTPAAAELAGAGSGLLTLGPVARHLDDLATATALGHPR